MWPFKRKQTAVTEVTDQERYGTYTRREEAKKTLDALKEEANKEWLEKCKALPVFNRESICPKCGYKYTYCQYSNAPFSVLRPSFECMKRTCCDCSYTWWERLDTREEPPSSCPEGGRE